ncbi:MAG: hypothetical protein MJE68_29565, partial [Proteobacteria bacterium]|nr:hypothetical protein [Pseudomonadota bacterium]
ADCNIWLPRHTQSRSRSCESSSFAWKPKSLDSRLYGSLLEISCWYRPSDGYRCVDVEPTAGEVLPDGNC